MPSPTNWKLLEVRSHQNWPTSEDVIAKRRIASKNTANASTQGSNARTFVNVKIV